MVKESAAGNGQHRPPDSIRDLDPHHLFDDPDGFAPRLIRKRARRLARRPEFRGSDWRDISQDLMLDVVRRLPKFNPSRARLTTFLFRLLARELVDLIAKANAKKRCGQQHERPLDEERLGHDCLRRHRSSTSSNGYTCFEFQHDLETALAALSPHLRSRWTMLLESSPTAVARKLGIPLPAVLHDIAQIRSAFEDRSLRDYLE